MQISCSPFDIEKFPLIIQAYLPPRVLEPGKHAVGKLNGRICAPDAQGSQSVMDTTGGGAVGPREEGPAVSVEALEGQELRRKQPSCSW